MKPPPFEYHAPPTLVEALTLLAQHGDEAKALAGGQSLIPVLNFRLARPSVIVDLNRIDELIGIDATGPSLRVAAMTRQRAAERSTDVAERAPMLAAALTHVAHPQIRTRGTIGGSVAHADPAAELPAVMLALDARFRLRRGAEERTVAAGDFFTGLFSTALEVDELLIDIEIPAPAARSGWAFEEVARRHGDFALVAVAARVVLDSAGAVSDARLAYVNAGPGPFRSARAEAVLVGQTPDPDLIRAAAAAAFEDARPAADVHASAAYRRQLTRVLTARALAAAFARAAA
ncbi:MAG TPA: xanthine dehydrogenase family protein subunit M [Longimicrobiales bacterium]|nr:xanthine dehydrogenase family protein subunit M [Longimicrobiales bacterium]